ncbi:MAG: AlkZ family DNA glycosylase [Anaerolineae bacterium]|nr:AlkZ family DNA glycosylase [Anaerolineae bacterium]
MNPQIGQMRLYSQRICGGHFATAADVVRWMGAMQAQDYGQSLWAIGTRMQSGTVVDVEQAIVDGKILRTWPMRGTIHFVPAEDARWITELCAIRLETGRARRRGQLELDDEAIARCGDILKEVLADGRLTRSDVLQNIEDRGIPMHGQRGYHVLTHYAQHGMVCIGPMEGKEQTFVLLDQWVPNLRVLQGDDALSELAERFFISHGPATEYDLARWAGITLTEARRGIERASAQLVTQEIDGTTYWLTQDVADFTGDEGVYLLAGFDEFLLGYKDRSTVVPEAHADKIVPGNNGMFMPFIVENGLVVGVWKRKLKKKAVDFTIELFEPKAKLAKRASEQASIYADFMGLPVDKIEVL